MYRRDTINRTPVHERPIESGSRMNSNAADSDTVATVNGVALHVPGEHLTTEALRQRACMELLRQAAQSTGLLAASDVVSRDGIISDAASRAIERLIEQAVPQSEPSEAACRRYYEAHRSRYSEGARARVRHVLFAVTPGVNVAALRARAESALIELRCKDGSCESRFASLACELSNCPSGVDGGYLGWLTVADCAPEFGAAVFGDQTIGVLSRLVHSRFGFHVVEVLERDPGRERGFVTVRGAIAAHLRRQAFVTALQRYMDTLAADAVVAGVSVAPSPG